MDIQFKTKKLEKTCNDFKRLSQAYGERQAARIALRLQQIAAADDLSVLAKLPHLHCHELKGNRKGQLAIDLVHPYRLVFSADEEPAPRKADGGLDWSRVHTVRILDIEDYHGKRK
jgi:proteic killer suppression protein